MFRARGGSIARGRGGAGGRGGGSFRDNSSRPVHTFNNIIELGKVMHTCENELVCQCTLKQAVPYFNGRVCLENKQEIGKVDEILGPINEFYFSVKMSENMKASSVAPNTVLFVDTMQTLPLSRFLPKPVDPRDALLKKKKKRVKDPNEPVRSRGGGFARGGRGRGGRFGGGMARRGSVRGRGRGQR